MRWFSNEAQWHTPALVYTGCDNVAGSEAISASCHRQAVTHTCPGDPVIPSCPSAAGHLTYECRNFLRADPTKDIHLDISSTSSEESEAEKRALSVSSTSSLLSNSEEERKKEKRRRADRRKSKWREYGEGGGAEVVGQGGEGRGSLKRFV